MADFEEAIEATKFGTFNILIMLLGLPSGWVTIFETTDISFVNPVAHCDLNYGSDEGGFIFSVTYLGMLTGSPVWGFFSDTFGRRKVIIFCYCLHAIVVIITGQSQTYIMLLVTKFIGGFIVNGPFSILTTIFSEFHSAKYRARVMLMIGVIAATANIILPIMAWGVLLTRVNISIGDYKFHSWNILVHLCAFPSIVCAIAYIFVPESPKYLMATGKNGEALLVFKKMYRMNTGKPENTYPITDLVEEVLLGMDDDDDDDDDQNISKPRKAMRMMVKGFKQSSKLFLPPHVKSFVIVCIMQIGVMMGLNTFRLWVPEFFTGIEHYRKNNNGSSSSICNMLPPKKFTKNDDYCKVETSFVYLNAIMISVVIIAVYVVINFIINKLGKKNMMFLLASISGVAMISIYFTPNHHFIIGMTTIFLACAAASTIVILTIIVDLFPTTLRTLALALSMMMGRVGTMTGTAVFSYLLDAGCAPAFIFIGTTFLVCALLVAFLPKTDMKALQ